MVLAAGLAGCGLLGSEQPEAPVDPCPRLDVPARRLAGAMIRQPDGTGVLEIVPVEGKTARSGEIKRLRLGDYTFKARPGTGGALEGRRGAMAEPVAGVDATAMAAYVVSYARDGQDYGGRVVAGLPASGERMPDAGQGRYRGPVRLSVQDKRPGADGTALAVTGTAELDVGFGSRQVEVRLEGLAAEGGAVPFERVTWTGIGMCGVRVGSTGNGGFQALGAGGRPVDFVGPGADAPGGTAVLDATFYGFDKATAQPREIGGVLLIQGDRGVISGVFVGSQAD
jgi:hypothetical protein